MDEKHIEQQLTQHVKNLGGIALKLTTPGTAGIPDRLILLPKGHIGFIELKAPNKKPRPLQQHRINQLQQLGFHATYINHPNQIRNAIHEIQTT
ncbi:VRR-NUC domain-containing protein [Corynebacterium diphtheriae]|uniref:VRR-NUC domain-containing protein n=1 Tax=Corynebacterium rouxii TaxID=2719119 RepID=A0A6I8MC90_9CORY|nr:MULTISPECIES: VRR-NUC domain-containing protein [Corynebacterium]CAB0518882.1 VRR-NUC domain-containing protein [Corynebacterium diphtheriae]OWO24043.1 nuclease [Corynebacterium diphtheriae bv. gravis]CAB0525315.1 VRR-NUC domain-containing protein [Corynebacterium diphtheriae]CAB0543039.1 VRR-NUC domain-containing protein [Corynebacterium diphtheriae]CAB0574406.1 VRR-NUC domain-containing protein [Corynebacterium diphtheriae]